MSNVKNLHIIVAIQECQLNKLNFRAFKRMAKIARCKLVMHSKAIMTEIQQEDGNKARRSGGMAIWFQNPLYKTYNINKLKNTQYIQTMELTTKQNPENIPTNTITNACCRPLGHEHIEKFYKQLMIQK